MKKRVIAFLSIVICVLVFAVVQPKASYAANNIALTGDKTVRAGETIVLSFEMSGSGILGFTAKLQYDDSLLVLDNITTVTKNWLTEQNDGNIIVYDNSQKSPINKTVTVFTMTLTVKSDVAAGEKIVVSVNDVVASDGDNDIEFGNAAYSVTISAPKSSDADIAELKLSNAALSKEFDKNIAEYDVTVPFSVQELDISITTSDKNATCKIDGNKNFEVGKNTVKITVTAENGAQKTYTLNVVREQDPNYKPCDNSQLSQITLSEGKVSPAFSADITEYVVYLPYETAGIVVSGVTADKNATVTSMEYVLKDGNNRVAVVCTAEDGVSKTEYILNIYRMPKYNGELPNITDGTSTPTPTPSITQTPTPDKTIEPTPTLTPTLDKTPEPTPTPSANPTTVPSAEPVDNNRGTNVLTVVAIVFTVIAIVLSAAAVTVMYVYGKKSNP